MTQSRQPSRSSGNRVKTTLGYSNNARRNQEAWKRMSRSQREVGLTEAEIVEQHRAMRARVLARYGVQEKAA